MKLLVRYLFVISFILCNLYTSFGQYISLDGRQFKDENGENFYPMVMNYMVNLIYEGNLQLPITNFEPVKLAPDLKFGLTPGYDFANIDDGTDRIAVDFQEIKNLGFNVIRLVLDVPKIPDTVTEGFSFMLNRFDCNWYDTVICKSKQVFFHPPYDPFYNPATKFIFDKYIEIAKIADSVGLKLWIGCGGGWVINTDHNINDYTNYLSALASYIHQDTLRNLFCYEFYGEPSSWEIFLSPTGFKYHTKPVICEIANKWDSTMKANDPDHLTTIGGTGLNDPPLWDPVCLNVDFTNIHLYLDARTFEWRTDNYPNGNDPDFLTHAIKRFKDVLYIYDQKFIKPYILGETSFPGENVHNNPYMRYPYAVYGDEEDGRNFVGETFPLVKNSKASGYQWWLFQNLHWAEVDEFDTTSPKPNNYLADVKECYHGLLRFGDPDTTIGYESHRKLAAEKFIEYITTPPPYSPPDYGPQTPNTDLNDPYYNPYNHPIENPTTFVFNNIRYYGSISGTVKDQFEHPVVGAIVFGGSWVGTDIDEYHDPAKPEDLNTFYVYRTFTDSEGEFILNAHDYLPGSTFNPDIRLDNAIQYFTIVAYGANESDQAEYVGHWNPILKKDTLYHLKTLQSKVDVEIKDIIVPIGQVRNFEAYSTLTATTLTIEGDYMSNGGNSEIKATNEVTLKDGFNAIKGSEVYIFNDPISIDCDELNFSSNKKNACEVDSEKINLSDATEITINFNNHTGYSSIFPNPNNGNFTFILQGAGENLNLINSITITNTVGNILMERKFLGNQLQIHLLNADPGVYFLNFQSDSKVNTIKFIVL